MLSNRINLMQLLTSFQIGGTERQVANLALGVDCSKFALHLACLRNFGELLADLERLHVPRPEFRIGRLYAPRTLWQAVRLACYIKTNRIQIVHSYGFYSNVFAVPVAKLVGTPIIVASIRDTGNLLTPMQTRVQKLVCRLADCILVNADAIRDNLLEQGYDPDKIIVIRNGITMARFARRQPNHLLRRDLGVPLSARLIAVISRLNHMKGVHYFLEAAVVLAARYPDLYFLVVGDGGSRKELEEHARRLGLGQRIVFTGFRTDVPDLLSEVTISVLPSLSEGTSNTLLESMATGVPVIATQVGGNTEVVENEISGLLVPPRDSAALAAATSRLLEDPGMALSLGQAGLRRVNEVYSISGSVRETELLYQRLASVKGCV